MAESSSSNLTKNTICSNIYDEGEEENHETQHDELKRGPWSLDEDSLLIHYIACHGEGRWNLLAECSGLKRTGKSCRLRWLNYLKPDVKRGNLSIEEQILIIELQSKMGNRWSKIAKHLPGRTDNEIKNYWRTRMQKLERRRLKIDNDDAYGSPSVPRLIPNMEEVVHSPLLPQPPTTGELEGIQNNIIINHDQALMSSSPSWGNTLSPTYAGYESSYDQVYGTASITSANDSFSCLTSPNCYNYMMNNTNLYDIEEAFNNLASTDTGQGLFGDSVSNCHLSENNWAMGDDVAYDLWK